LSALAARYRVLLSVFFDVDSGAYAGREEGHVDSWKNTMRALLREISLMRRTAAYSAFNLLAPFVSQQRDGALGNDTSDDIHQEQFGGSATELDTRKSCSDGVIL
jgi:hypothetical protein